MAKEKKIKSMKQLVMHNIIDNELVEVDSIEDARGYVKANFVEGGSMHPDFRSFDVYEKVGQVFVEENDKGEATGIGYLIRDEFASDLRGKNEEMPRIEIKNSMLIISMTASELKFVAEQNHETPYVVTNENEFLSDFAVNLANNYNPNSVERGMTSLQEFLENVIHQTYINGSEYIYDKNDPPT